MKTQVLSEEGKRFLRKLGIKRATVVFKCPCRNKIETSVAVRLEKKCYRDSVTGKELNGYNNVMCVSCGSVYHVTLEIEED